MKSEVYNCDCLEFMRGLPDNAFDLAIADPPYGGANDENIGGGGRFGGRFDRYKTPRRTHFVFGLRKKNRSYENRRNVGGEVRKKNVAWDTAPDEAFFSELRRVSRNQIIWGANYFPGMPPTRCFVVWEKLSISDSFSMAMAEYAYTSFSGNAKLFRCAPQDPTRTRFHPTQKPVALYAWLLEMFAKPGDTIFDPMMGSQSSRIAAHKMGFDYVGCERDGDYFKAGCARYDRECAGVIVAADGTKKEQMKLF